MSVHEPIPSRASEERPPTRLAAPYRFTVEIVNLAERCVEIYREPGHSTVLGRPAYSVRQTFAAEEAVPLRIGEQECGTTVAVAELMPQTA